jgi:5-methylcytosine-specific restriction endonuclease McrA
MSYPKTRKEALLLGETRYFTGKECKYGHLSPRWSLDGACLVCKAKRVRLYFSSPKGKEVTRKYALTGKGKEKQRRSDLQRRAYKLAHNADRRAKGFLATPRWLTKDHRVAMRSLYKDAVERSSLYGVSYVVDHIIPLNGKTVCGLHVPWNLRVISEEENLHKGNRYEG